MDMVAGRIDRSDSTITGVACGIGAGALWGLVFLAPELAGGFSPLQLTVGRYLAYGAIAAIWIAPRWRRLSASLNRRTWWALAGLAFTGNTLFYILLSNAVQMGGIAMTSLVVGFMPLAVTIIGSCDHDAVPLVKLLPSLLLCVGGAVCIGWQAMAVPISGPVTAQVTGLLCAIGALTCWTFYAVANSRWIARLQQVSAHDWNLLIGVATGAQSLVLLPIAILIGFGDHDGSAWIEFAAISIGMALVASIAGNALWNRMSQLLPLTMVGQMILFETLFALLYGFLWEQRWPTLLEMAAALLVMGSVLSCIAAHRNRPAG